MVVFQCRAILVLQRAGLVETISSAARVRVCFVPTYQEEGEKMGGRKEVTAALELVLAMRDEGAHAPSDAADAMDADFAQNATIGVEGCESQYKPERGATWKLNFYDWKQFCPNELRGSSELRATAHRSEMRNDS